MPSFSSKNNLKYDTFLKNFVINQYIYKKKLDINIK